MNVYYINHMNERLDLDTEHMILQYQELFDYSWDAVTTKGKISGFKRESATIPITVAIVAESREVYVEEVERFHRIVETDVFANIPGFLYVGDYYLECFISGDKKKDAFMGVDVQIKNLTIVTDHPFWIKKTTTSFNYGSGSSKGKNLDFNRDFPSDYTSNLLGSTLNNTGFAASNFLIQISGPCINPMITIAGHEYEVMTSVAAGEVLEIDSIGKTIELIKAGGTKKNCFNLRNRESYIFEKIPPGVSGVLSSSHFRFDITILDERSEPRWIWYL